MTLLSCLLASASLEANPRFVDATDSSRIDFRHVSGASGQRYLPETMGAGGAVLDFDNDGWMDVFLVQSGPLPGHRGEVPGHRLYRNRGDGSFDDVTEGSGLGELSGYGQGAVAADFDGDGWVDIYLTQLGPNRLYRNLGNGRFEDVSQRAGVADPAWSSSAAFLDADGDGLLDLYVANYLQFTLETHRDCSRADGLGFYCHPDVYPAAADTFYRNLGNGRFQDATEAFGFLSKGKGLGVAVLDHNRDGRPDIYVANDSTPNFLYVNMGGGRFEEQGLMLGVAYNEDGRSEAGMGVDVGDTNGDGRTDIVVTNLSMEANALYRGEAEGFRYATREAGLFGPSYPLLGFGVALADFDNDGAIDLFVVNGDVQDNIAKVNDALSYAQPAQLFRNVGSGRFEPLSAAELGAPSVPRVGRALLVLDFDNDGWLDVLITGTDERARLHRNTAGDSGWSGLDLRFCGSPAVGARVTLRHAGHDQTRELKAGSGYQTSMDHRLHFGIGKLAGPAEYAVRWPDGFYQDFTIAQPSVYARTCRCSRGGEELLQTCTPSPSQTGHRHTESSGGNAQ